MGNDCENCGAQIPYGINLCESCEMGITEKIQSNNQLFKAIYEQLDTLDKDLNRAYSNLSKKDLRKLVFAIIRNIKYDIKRRV